MHGLGDCLHQRALIRQLVDKYDLYLETSWPQVYWDIPINFIARGTKLRTQLKNQENSKSYFSDIPSSVFKIIKIFYKPEMVRSCKSVVRAMLKTANLDENDYDFSFCPKPEWIDSAKNLLAPNVENKPILIYRPLCIRQEWGGCVTRNPDIGAYNYLIELIKKDFFVISIADIKPPAETMVGIPIQADLEFHEGQLSFEQIAGLFALSSLVYTSPGFCAVLARSMGINLITLFGGYEDGNSFSSGKGNYLAIEPINPCPCFSHRHSCDKRIDVELAKEKIRGFINACIRKS